MIGMELFLIYMATVTLEVVACAWFYHKYGKSQDSLRGCQAKVKQLQGKQKLYQEKIQSQTSEAKALQEKNGVLKRETDITNKRLTKELHDSNEEKNSLIESFQKTLRQKETQIGNMENIQENLKLSENVRQELEMELEKKKEKHFELESMLVTTKEENNKIKIQLEDTQGKLEHELKTNETLQENLNKEKENNAHVHDFMSKECLRKQREVTSLEKNKKQVETELQNKMEIISELESTLSTTEESQMKIKLQLEDSHHKIEEVLNENDKYQDALKVEKENNQRACHTITKIQQESEEKFSELEGQIEMLQQENKNKTEKNSTLTINSQSLMEENQLKELQIKCLQNEMAQEQSEWNEFYTLYLQQRKINDREAEEYLLLKQQIITERTKNEKLCDEICDTENLRTLLQEEAEQKCGELESQIEKLQQENKDVTEKNSTQTINSEELMEENRLKELQIKCLQSEMAQAKNEWNKLNTLYLQQKQIHDREAEKYLQMEQQIISERTQSEKLEDQIQMLKEENEFQTERNSSLEFFIQELKEENEHNQSRIQGLENDWGQFYTGYLQEEELHQKESVLENDWGQFYTLYLQEQELHQHDSVLENDWGQFYTLYLQEKEIHQREISTLQKELCHKDEAMSAMKQNTQVIRRKKNPKQQTYHDKEIKIIKKSELLPHLKIIEELGRGGYGRADLVEFQGKRCVLKTAFYSEVPMNELKIMAHLNGAGGAPLLFASTKRSFLCSFVGDMELVEAMNEKLDQTDMIHKMYLAAKQLKEIHNLGISHNDIKSDNVMINTQTNTVNIIDFGISCQLGESREAVDDPREFKRLFWMSPEAKLGEPITTASDIYSLGTLLADVLSEYAEPDPIALSLVGRCICENPFQRPSMDEFITVLKFASEARGETFIKHANRFIHNQINEGCEWETIGKESCIGDREESHRENIKLESGYLGDDEDDDEDRHTKKVHEERVREQDGEKKMTQNKLLVRKLCVRKPMRKMTVKKKVMKECDKNMIKNLIMKKINGKQWSGNCFWVMVRKVILKRAMMMKVH